MSLSVSTEDESLVRHHTFLSGQLLLYDTLVRPVSLMGKRPLLPFLFFSFEVLSWSEAKSKVVWNTLLVRKPFC